jgi:magnesium chelatase accessory protein
MGASSDSFGELASSLAARFSIVAPDLPGHARTRTPSSFQPSRANCARAVADLVGALELRPSMIVGHSAGAALAVTMTAGGMVAPKLIVGLAPALRPLTGVARALFPRSARLFAHASTWIDMHVRDPRWVALALRSTGSVVPPSRAADYERLFADGRHVSGVLATLARWELDGLERDLDRLKVPLIVLAGEHDRAVTAAQLRSLAVRTPGMELDVVADAGHLLHEERPGAIADRIATAYERKGSDHVQRL